MSDNMPGVKSAEEWMHHPASFNPMMAIIRSRAFDIADIRTIQLDAFNAGRRQGMTEAAEILLNHGVGITDNTVYRYRGNVRATILTARDNIK